MSEILKKPYQISIWEDELVESENGNYYREVKIADIGSNTMTSKNRVYSPVLTENMNGEQTLTFSLKYKYFDEVVGDFVVNPFVSFLVNERKVKLFYKDKWRDFVIKEREEQSEEYTFSYTCTDASVQELSKNGYGITFDAELGNNQGTVVELGKQALEGTDWTIDEEDCDLLQQTISEPIYECTVQDNFEAYNVDKDRNITIEQDEIIYVFYSYINNKTTEFVQFLRAADREKWSYDDNGAIIGTNYRLLNPVTYTEENDSIVINYGTAAINVGPVSTEHQGYRLVYSSLTKYDPVLEKTVDLYQTEYDNTIQDIYHYTGTEYITASSLTNFVTNGGNFSYFDKTTIDGWSNAVMSSGSELPTINLTTYPEILATTPLIEPTRLNELRGYLELQYPKKSANIKYKYDDAFYNSGILDHSEALKHIAIGDKFLLRLRYKFSLTKHGELICPRLSNNTVKLRAVVAKYINVEKEFESGSKVVVKQVESGAIFFDFNGEYQEGNVIISGGQLIGDRDTYLLDGIPVSPSDDCVYRVEDEQGNITDYVWIAEKSKYEVKNNQNFANYYYTTAEAIRPLPRSVLDKNGTRIGLFLYNENSEEQYVYLEDIQLTRYAEDKNDRPIFLGTAPEAKINVVDYYYLKPEDGMSEDEVNLYTSLDSVADDLYVDVDSIIPIRNEKCEKILSINENQSNCFNILQTLCETFECWLKISVEHEENGQIKLDDSNRPIKRISFKKYIGKENFAGFKYGINLSSINRSVYSDEFVTKLIVGQSSNDYTDSGILDISEAKANPTGECYILNFDYYLKQGLIANPEDFKKDLADFNQKLKKINLDLQSLNKEYIQLGSVHERANVNYTLYSELYNNVSEEYAKALQEFATLNNGMTYEDYVKSNPKESDLVNNETLRAIVDKVYSNSLLAKNYKQLLDNAKDEFLALDLKYSGAKDYSFSVTTSNSPLTKLVLSDYVEGFECEFVREEKDENDKKTTIRQPWKSNLIEKEFIDDVIYPTLIIKKIPENYRIEYTIEDEILTSTIDEPTVFTIYDVENQKGIARRFKLIPLDDFDATHKGLQEQIDELLEQKRQIEKDFYSKYSRFIQEGTWESSDYIDSELYYLDAVQVSNTSAQPQVSYTINVVEISEIEGMENYDFDIGDKTYIEDTDFFGWYIYEENGVQVQTPVKEEVIVSEIEWHLDEPDYNIITIQNYKTQFQDLFQRISATVQSVQYNQASYIQAANILDPTGNINSNLLVGSLNAIAGQSFDLASGGVLKSTSEGLIVRNLTEPGNLLIIKSRGIEKSNDGGRTWDNLISAEGVNTEQLTAGTINTQNILIMDGDNPTFRWDKAGLSAYGYGQNGDYDLKTYVRYDKYGIYGIKDGEDYVASSLNDIKDKANFGLTWDGFFIKNKYRNGYVSISSTDDFQVVANDQERIKIGATEFEEDGVTPKKYGLLIKNDEGEIVFETGDDGNLEITGTINATAGEFTGRISAAEGEIGGFIIGETELYNGEFGESDSIFLSTGYDSNKPIAGFEGEDRWAIGIGKNFGVNTSGELYATNARIRGTIEATDGYFTGRIDATSGTFTNEVRVGGGDKYIVLQGYPDRSDSLIASSDYINNPSAGWAISGYGDAIFNNVSVRGAIKTAVFEYSEIEAVGGAFLFRPSSTIKSATIVEHEPISTEPQYDLVVTLEKPNLFQVNEWVKLSNINSESDVHDVLNDGGLTHVYKIIATNGKKVKLEYAGNDFVLPEETSGPYGEWGEIIESEDPEQGPSYSTVEFSSPYSEEELAARPELAELTTYVDLKDDNGQYILLNAPKYEVYFNSGPTVIKNRNIELRNPVDGTAQVIVNEVVVSNWNTDDGATGEYIVHNYIGNLNIFFPNTSDTGEDFLVADVTDPDGNRTTRIYSNLGGVRDFILRAYETKEGLEDLEGGSLISFGYHTSSEEYDDGVHNYGIGINSSDNYVNLPERAISLFETTIHPEETVKVTYDYKGILGTLPPLGDSLVSDSIYSNMEGTQGIFTNNMYIGDSNQYLAFYTDGNGDKKLRIKASELVFEVTDESGHHVDWKDVQDVSQGADGEDAINVVVDSNLGNFILTTDTTITLTCTVYSGTKDITNQVTSFTWVKNNQDGTIDANWIPTLASMDGRSILVDASDIQAKAIFICTVEF